MKTTNCIVQMDLASPIVHSPPWLAGMLAHRIYLHTKDVDLAHSQIPIFRDEHSLIHCSLPLLHGAETLPERIPVIGRFEPRDLMPSEVFRQIQLNANGNFPQWSAKKVAQFGNAQNSYERMIVPRIFYSVVVTDMGYFEALIEQIKGGMVGKRHQTGGAIVRDIKITKGRGGKMVLDDGMVITAIPVQLGKHYGASRKNIVAHQGWQLPIWKPENGAQCYVPPIYKNWTEEEIKTCL